MKKNVTLIATGSIGIDDIKTPNEKRKNLLGGSLPFITAAASFFTRCGAVGVVGADFPAVFTRRWNSFGVDLKGVQRKSSGATFRWSCEYDQEICERTTLKTDLGVFENFVPKLPGTWKNVPFLLLGNIQPSLQMNLLNQMGTARFVALDTMNLWIQTQRAELAQVIACVDLLIVNDSEARMLTNKRSLLDCATAIMNMGPTYVIIKKGEHGAMLFYKDRIFTTPAYPVNMLADPTGAGDTFAGAFMGYLARAERATFAVMRKAMVFATATASFCVEGFSLECLEQTDLSKIEQRASELQRMTRA